MHSSVHRFHLSPTLIFTLFLLLMVSRAHAATYYVNPSGDDSKNGLSIANAWRTLAKVNSSTFAAGDSVLFARGGEWREHLWANSSGAAGNPITFDAYGSGAKPKFWGSEILANGSFNSSGGNTYTYSIPNLPGGQIYVLQDHQFLGTFESPYSNPTLTITSPTDPRSDGKVYTVCVRGNMIFNNFKDHLVFRNLIADETAGENGDGSNQGYGIRIEGGTDILVEDCEAYHCGRHNIGVINTAQFVGRRVTCGYAAPRFTGSNSIFVSYADGAGVHVHQWIDCVSYHAEVGDGGYYDAFDAHGNTQGPVTFTNFRAHNGKVSLQRGPDIFRGGELSGMSRLEIFGNGVLVDGTVLRDGAFVDQYANNGNFQNMIFAGGTPSESGAFIFRGGVSGNTVRFCTIALASHECFAFYNSPHPSTRWFGNILLGTVNSGGDPSDVTFADYNFYGTSPTIMGQSLTAWKASGKDAHALSGDPLFTNAAAGDYRLQPTSAAIDAAGGISGSDLPATDIIGTSRPAGAAPDMGALERTASGGTTTSTTSGTGTGTGTATATAGGTTAGTGTGTSATAGSGTASTTSGGSGSTSTVDNGGSGSGSGCGIGSGLACSALAMTWLARRFLSGLGPR